MRRNVHGLTLITVTLAAALCSAQAGAGPSPVRALQNAQVAPNYGNLPLTFELNQGQAAPQAKFIFRGKNYSALLTAGEMVLSLRPSATAVPSAANVAPNNKSQKSVATTLQFKLVGAARNPAVIGEDPQPGRVNYFIGKDPAKWQRNVPTYGQVRYKNVYPGIDLLYYGNHHQLEYDFAVALGADPRQIQFQITGARQIELDEEGKLVLETSSGELHFQTPVVYQESSGVRVPVHGSYVLKDPTHVAFQLGQYDPNKPLVIDPVLVYGTYLGGTGTDQASGIAVDGTGSVYVAGYTDAADFLLTTVGVPATNSNHIFVAKLDATGSSLVYADYIGGNGEDYGIGLALDSANNAYVTGSTTSSNFPSVNPYQAVEPGSYSGFLTKISADGSSLSYSTYVGGNGFDQPVGVAVDTLGEAYIAGTTTSLNFPVVNAIPGQEAALANQGGLYGYYGFVSKFAADGSSLVFSTYLAGNSTFEDCGNLCWPIPYTSVSAVALDANGSAYVTGVTTTNNFPATPGAYLPGNSPQPDTTIGFVSKLASSGSLDYSTYFYGSSGNPIGIGAITVDGSGSAYVAGTVTSDFTSDVTFPLTSTTICDPRVYGFGCSDVFVTKFDPAASTLSYSTFLGPNNFASPQSIALDSSNNAYVLASTSSAVFGTNNGIESYTSGHELLLVEIDASASTELFATYLGGSGDDFGSGIVLDANGNIYVTGSTDSTDFPVTQGAFQNILGGNTDAFVMKIGSASDPSVTLNPYSLLYLSQAVGSTSQPQTVLLRNMGSSPLSIPSITIGGDFTETNSCGTTVAAAGSCTLSITFTPTASGARSGSIVIQDNAAGSPHVITLSGTATGPGAGLSPTSLTFSAELLGVSGAAQAETLTNTGNTAMNVSAVQTTGDFAQANNCLGTLAPSSTCTINVTFTPTASGARTGALTISDGAPGSPQSVNLSGTGFVTAPLAAVSSSNVSFGSQSLTTSSPAQAVTLKNTGNAALAVNTIHIAGDFAQVNNCPASLVANASCTINITFTPTASGARTGTLTISDNAGASPQVVNLAGTGADFSLASAPSGDTVQPGSTATYTLTVSHVGGSLASSVKLSCGGLPANTSCSWSPSAVTPGASSASSTLSLATVATVSQASPQGSTSAPIYAVWIQLQAIGLFGVMLAVSKRRTRKMRGRILAACLITFLIFPSLLAMTGCAGGTGIAPTQRTGTAPGTYTVTLAGTSGNLQHSIPVTLTVQ
jgi:hypothetical protein